MMIAVGVDACGSHGSIDAKRWFVDSSGAGAVAEMLSVELVSRVRIN